MTVALYTSAWIEIWGRIKTIAVATESHSTRVRGLKCRGQFPIRDAWVSHSTRVRGLKYDARVCIQPEV